MLYLSVLKQRTEAAAHKCSLEKVYFEISQNSQENTCTRVSFLMKLQVKANNFIKSFLTEHLRWLLLNVIDSTNLPFEGCVYQECIYKPEYEW